MSIDDATPRDWDRANQRPHIKEYVDPFDTPPTSDPVNCPDHYNAGKLECIDAIEASMSVEAFKGYLKGNVEKYVWRMAYKGRAVEDLRKAAWYLNRLIQTEVKNPSIK